jgi:transcriptional regulator with XRE-family HTH domain
MKIVDLYGDEAVLQEIGERVARTRLELNLTQDETAQSAGVSKRTVERLEAGHSVQLGHFLRICRALGLLDRLDAFLPEQVPSPIDLLRFRGRERKRASGVREISSPQLPWRWGEDEGGEKGGA